MSHRHVVVCDECGVETQHHSFGLWVRISLGGEFIPGLDADLCSQDCLAAWLRAEADRREP